jgi:hypothetical protein
LSKCFSEKDVKKDKNAMLLYILEKEKSSDYEWLKKYTAKNELSMGEYIFVLREK